MTACLEVPGVTTLRLQWLELPAGSVKVGDRLVLPTSGRDFPVYEIREYDDGTVALFWRVEVGDPWGPAATAWRPADWRKKTEPEISGVFHKRPDDLVTVRR